MYGMLRYGTLRIHTYGSAVRYLRFLTLCYVTWGWKTGISRLKLFGTIIPQLLSRAAQHTVHCITHQRCWCNLALQIDIYSLTFLLTHGNTAGKNIHSRTFLLSLYNSPTLLNSSPDYLRDPAVYRDTIRQYLKTLMFASY